MSGSEIYRGSARPSPSPASGDGVLTEHIMMTATPMLRSIGYGVILGYDSYGKVVGAGESAAETIKAAATTLADAKKGPAAMSRLLSTINSETYATIKPILPESITTAIDQKGGIDSAQDLVKKL